MLLKTKISYKTDLAYRVKQHVKNHDKTERQ